MPIVDIKENSGIPKYRQIVSAIEDAILAGTLKKGDQLPSLNSIKIKHKVSRDTVLTAFSELKNRGIIMSVAGKGYYVSSQDIFVAQKIFLLFDELNSFKEDLYNSLKENIGENIHLDIFFHHFNEDMFSKLIDDNIGNYSSYIIMPANLKNTKHIIDKLPKDKVYILDQTHPELSDYPAVYQNFEQDIFSALTEATHSIKRYKKLILIFDYHKQPQGMLKGFKKYCNQNNFQFEVIESIKGRCLEKGDIYVIPEDRSLIKIIKKIKKEGLTLSKNIGIISYNDTMLKEIVEGGITTISTDFNKMGKQLAQMIINKGKTKIENPNNLILRNSL